MKLVKFLVVAGLVLILAGLWLQSSPDQVQEIPTSAPTSSPLSLPSSSQQKSASLSSPLPTRASQVQPTAVGVASPTGELHIVSFAVPMAGLPAESVAELTPTPTPTPALAATCEPSYNSTLHDLHAPLTITFAQPVPLPRRPSLVISPTLPGQTIWRDARTLTFTPDAGWTPDTSYQVYLDDKLKSRFGTAPVIERLFSNSNYASNPRETSIGVNFGVQVDHASVESAFHISPTVAGRLHWTDDRRLVFEPQQDLDYLSTYHVSLQGEILDAAGTPLAVDQDWSFSTRSALASAQPEGVASLDSAIQLRFDVPVDQASVEAALNVTPTVSGSFEWQENKLTFTPDDYWNPDSTYHATLNSSARSADGKPLLNSAYEWRFQTGSVPYTIGFGYGPNVQVLDAGGSRALQTEFGCDQAALRLYELSVPQFLDRYTSSFRGIGPDERKLTPINDLPLRHSWEQSLGQTGEVIIPATVPLGLYVIEAQCGPGWDRLIVVLTRHTLVLKQAEKQLVTWASTMSDHTPAAAMHLRFYDRDGTLVAQGATEERGLHRTLVPVNTEPLIVVGELDGDVTVSGLGQEWQAGDNGWGWGWWKTSPSAPDATMYAYTDRPIYRPGQTVHARAVIRRDDDAVYSLPGDAEVILRLRDARDNVVAVRRLTPDEFGAVYADFEIADGGTVGTYNLEVSALGESARQSLLVEAYRKPDYEITLTPSSEQDFGELSRAVVAGEPLTLSVQANYFFGPPVANARVELLPYVVGYYEWYEQRAEMDYGYAYDKLRQVGYTDANGRLSVVLPASLTHDGERQVWNWEATVTDASDLSVSAHARVVVHRAAFGLSLLTDRYHFRPGEAIPITLLARDHHALAQSGAELSVGLYAWDRETRAYDQLVAEARATTGADGQAQVTLQTTQSNWYRLRATGADSQGRQIQAEDWILVYADGSAWGAAGSELKLSTDRARYAPGDVVSLLVESPAAGPALLSFERGTTRRETVVQLEQGPNTLEFELQPDDAPNIHVAVALWRPTQDDDEQWYYMSRVEQELLTASVEILVPPDDRRLNVSITPDRSQYAPRDEALFLVQITDQDGRPVQAGFSLALVDEAIFSLAADRTPDIFDAFYSPRPNIVRTYHSLRPARVLDGMGGGGGGDDMPGGSPRSDFPDTAFWAPALVTGPDGTASVRVPLPDSLTSWRAVARAVSVDTMVGQTTSNVIVALPLSIQPVLPRFLVQGDQVTLSAVLHNHTGEGRDASVRLSASGLELDEPLLATQNISLPAYSTVAVYWTVRAERLGQASARVDLAQGDLWLDGIVLPLPVVPLAIPQVQTLSAEVEGQWSETITLPDGSIPDISRWELSLAPSIATGMLDGLEFLIDYPFG